VFGTFYDVVQSLLGHGIRPCNGCILPSVPNNRCTCSVFLPKQIPSQKVYKDRSTHSILRRPSWCDRFRSGDFNSINNYGEADVHHHNDSRDFLHCIPA
ncbi:hypothetical protein COOONC_14258, partial [Cooperia oncophora]